VTAMPRPRGELAPSASVQVGGWRLEVLEVDRRAITRLRLVPLTDPTRDAGP
jgi:CBS domain containing-hemolysin-like protein